MKRDATIGQCPVCRATLPVPKDPHGQTCCPRCSAELWHLIFAGGPAFFVRRTGETIYDLLAGVAGDAFSPTEIKRFLLQADPLDISEFLSEVEDAARS